MKNHTLISLGIASLIALGFNSTAVAKPKLTIYATNWSEYSENRTIYPPYEYDGAYKNYQPWGTLKYVKNPNMQTQFQQADVIAWSFMQIWNSNYRSPKAPNIVSNAEWDGLMHFSDLYGSLPFEASWKTNPPETEQFLNFCKSVPTGTCSSIQLNGNTGKMQLFNYADRKGAGLLNSFGAFINSTKFGNAKRIIAIGGANTTDNGAISTYTFNAIFANQDKFLGQFKQWVDAFPNLKGVDYDFEPPINPSTGGQEEPGSKTITDYKNLFNLVKATREQLGNDAYISVTITPNLKYLEYINHSVQDGWFKKIAPYVNSINIMTYDFHGPWNKTADPYTTIHAYLEQPNTTNKNKFSITYATKTVINKILEYGMPANKLKLGLASYGRGYNGVSSGSDTALPGFEQPWTGSSLFPNNYYASSAGKGILPYKVIDKLIENDNYQSYDITMRDKNNKPYTVGSYIYNNQSKQFVGYQSPQQIKAICEFIKEKGLNGAILWSADTDLPTSNPKSLVASYRQYCQ